MGDDAEAVFLYNFSRRAADPLPPLWEVRVSALRTPRDRHPGYPVAVC